MSRELLENLLHELSQWLKFEDCDPVEWVVCGGMAMALQDLNPRTTRDVDVLGTWNSAITAINCIDDFPEKVKTCIRQVASNHPELQTLNEKWVNLGPGRLAKLGLPRGFEQRLTTMRFGDRLTLHLLHRTDLIALKLYAAADDMGPRHAIHCQDLALLNPTFQELDDAVEWIRTLPDFEEKRIELKNTVERLGHGDLAYYI